METLELKLTRIGNSRGIRLPARWLRHYGWPGVMRAEARSEGLLLRIPAKSEKLSWEQTAREMAVASKAWSDWDAVDADGLEQLPWAGHAAPAARRPRRSGQHPRR